MAQDDTCLYLEAPIHHKMLHMKVFAVGVSCALVFDQFVTQVVVEPLNWIGRPGVDSEPSVFYSRIVFREPDFSDNACTGGSPRCGCSPMGVPVFGGTSLMGTACKWGVLQGVPP